MKRWKEVKQQSGPSWILAGTMQVLEADESVVEFYHWSIEISIGDLFRRSLDGNLRRLTVFMFSDSCDVAGGDFLRVNVGRKFSISLTDDDLLRTCQTCRRALQCC